jgi:hypothetical protein
MISMAETFVKTIKHDYVSHMPNRIEKWRFSPAASCPPYLVWSWCLNHSLRSAEA